MDDESIPQSNGNIDIEVRNLDESTSGASDGSRSHENGSPTPTLCSDSTAVDEEHEVFSDAGSESLSHNLNSTAPSQICSLSVNLGQEYASVARRLLMAKIKQKYGVLFPHWVCECTTVPRNLGERKPHPSQYYPLREQREEWKIWQKMNPHKIDPGGEISLNEINWHSEDPDEKPPFQLWYLILAAIYGSPMKRLTEHEIKLCLIRRFSYFAFRQFSDWDIGDDDWFLDVSHELEQNELFTKMSICKSGQDDSSYYWTISQLPLNGNLPPRNQTLDNTSSVRSTQDTQDHPVIVVDRAPTIADDNPFKFGPPKIPISMLVHPASCDPLDFETVEVTAQDIELWCWLPS